MTTQKNAIVNVAQDSGWQASVDYILRKQNIDTVFPYKKIPSYPISYSFPFFLVYLHVHVLYLRTTSYVYTQGLIPEVRCYCTVGPTVPPKIKYVVRKYESPSGSRATCTCTEGTLLPYEATSGSTSVQGTVSCYSTTKSYLSQTDIRQVALIGETEWARIDSTSMSTRSNQITYGFAEGDPPSHSKVRKYLRKYRSTYVPITTLWLQ